MAKTDAKRTKPTEAVVVAAWNLFFNQNPERGVKVAKALGRPLIAKLTEALDVAPQCQGRALDKTQSILPIVAETAAKALKEK